MQAWTPDRVRTGKTISDGGLRRDVDHRLPVLDRTVVAGDEQVDGGDEEERERRAYRHARDEHEADAVAGRRARTGDASTRKISTTARRNAGRNLSPSTRSCRDSPV